MLVQTGFRKETVGGFGGFSRIGTGFQFLSEASHVLNADDEAPESKDIYSCLRPEQLRTQPSSFLNRE